MCNGESVSRTASMYVVAYLDMLGMTSGTGTHQENAVYETRKLYDRTKEIATRNCGLDASIVSEMFSDNIIVAQKLPSNPLNRDERIEDILLWCLLFQSGAVSGDFGWLTRGKVIIISDFYTGDVLEEAKMLRGSNGLGELFAKDPKIVIATEIIETLKNYGVHDDLIAQDSDGQYFLDFMARWTLIGESAVKGFEKIKSRFLPLNRNGVNRVIDWHVNYMNMCLESSEPESGYRLSI